MNQDAKEYLQAIEAKVIDFCKYLMQDGGVDRWDYGVKKDVLQKRITLFKENAGDFPPLVQIQVRDDLVHLERFVQGITARIGGAPDFKFTPDRDIFPNLAVVVSGETIPSTPAPVGETGPDRLPPAPAPVGEQMDSAKEEKSLKHELQSAVSVPRSLFQGKRSSLVVEAMRDAGWDDSVIAYVLVETMEVTRTRAGQAILGKNREGQAFDDGWARTKVRELLAKAPKVEPE